MFFSLRNRLIAVFVVLLVISFCVMFLISYNKSSAILRSDSETAALEKMTAYTALINSTIGQIYDFSSIIYNSEITNEWSEYVSDPKLSDGQKMLKNIQLSKFLTRTVNNYSIIATASIYRKDGLYVGLDNRILQDPSFLEADWYTDFYKSEQHWAPASVDPYEPVRLKQHEVISFLIPIGTFSISQATAVMKVNVRAEYFKDPLSQVHLGTHGTIFLLSGEGEPLLGQPLSDFDEPVLNKLMDIRGHGPREGVFYARPQGEDMIYVYKKLQFNDWMLVGAVSEKELLANLINLKSGILVATGTLLVFAVLAAVWISYSITKPLGGLVAAMRLVQRGEFAQAEQRIPERQQVNHEVGFVTATFRNMIVRLRAHLKSEFELKLRRQQAEYRALLMQINPHFLFNTLELLSSLVIQRRTDDAVDVIESLGKMLRFSLNAKSDLIPLRDEVTYTESFAAILNHRFAEQLDLSMENAVPDRPVYIVKFILQPLVENAVKYSQVKSDVAVVRIRIWEEEQRLLLQVRDNGVGMDPELVRQLNAEYQHSQLEQVLSTGGRQIGLRNILARCALYYGAGFAFSIQSAPEEGTTITLSLPIGEGDADV
ncbi:sensor histidine kinase [Paenibacillus sp. FSL R7-0216]|uniref:cache domain-containing sensor histidine kinase n=1 Tax=Paenibacillus sp. FSL R7-0216 TaxID=2921677 RepID=UPI0030DA3DC2